MVTFDLLCTGAAIGIPAGILIVTAWLTRRRPWRVLAVILVGIVVATLAFAYAATLEAPDDFYDAGVFRFSFGAMWTALVVAQVLVVCMTERLQVHRVVGFVLAAVVGLGVVRSVYEALPISRPLSTRAHVKTLDSRPAVESAASQAAGRPR